ncbi:hypothetical protein TIFTF001_033473 [Ficus carica]|uniref:Uncharacterized protein n=1 Tax=Ficus carica TaxID=3494 RepID=A0AA88E5C4_FICCA|nr:hypothetical protein TIFTF001_033473 [Ficus carica]
MNRICGEIPEEFTGLIQLVQLNLSRNDLSGGFPKNIGMFSKLESLDLSHNKLSGSSARNSDEVYVEDGGEWYDTSWLRMGIVVGFAVGFYGVCGNLLLYTSWGLAYFRFLDDLGDWLYVMIAVQWATFKRRFSR